jgi:hypothetical protein
VQIIVRVRCTPEIYSAGRRHSAISPPKKCPNCGQIRSLASLGYYERWLSGLDARDLRLLIRRFRCRGCGRTVSLLPDFAQPYRLVRNETIERYFARDLDRGDVRRWSELLGRYWRRFTIWLPALRRAAAVIFGRGPPASRPQKWWLFMVTPTRNLASLTVRLLAEVRVTIFGRYRCHYPSPPARRPQT